MKYKKLKDLVEINSENINKNYKERIINYLDTSNITKGKVDNIVKLSLEDAPSRAKRIVRKNDIIYSTVRPNLCHYGILRAPLKNMIVSTGFAVLRCKNEVLPEYLYSYITLPIITKKLYAIAETSTSAYPSIKKEDLEEIDIPLPSIEIQQKIARLLSDIERKIELNDRISSNLININKQIYKRWFVDFEFLNECGQPYKSSGGKMKDSELGQIPDGWKIIKLGDYLKVERGLSYKGKFLNDKGIPMINLGNIMPNGVFRLEKNKYYSGKFKDNVTTNVGEIVVANTDMTQNRDIIGSPVIIPSIYKSDKIIYSHHIYGIKNLKLPKLFVFYTLLTERYKRLVAGSATGTTVLALPKQILEDYKVVMPQSDCLEKFEIIANKIQEEKENIIKENIKLDRLREIILPKLMNGEINLDKIEI